MFDQHSVSLIIIGDEILEGRIQDLHVKWISTWCKNHHLTLKEARFIKDDILEIQETLSELSKKTKFIFITGGLGPTEDDKTKLALASLLDSELVENQKAKEYTISHYERINREWTPSWNSYHLLPKGVEPLKNPSGLAPGLYCQFENSSLFAVPGVPREMKSMINESVYPLIKNHLSIKETKTLQVRTVGIPEEKIFFDLYPSLWQELSKVGQVSSLPQVLGVDIIVRNLTSEQKDHLIQTYFTNSPLDPYIWQIGSLSLEEYILQVLRQKKSTLSLAESCTGGLSANRFTDIAGCSDVFMGSAITYSNFAKESLIGVKNKTLESYGAVSKEVALEMAEGALLKYQSDFALSFTGFAGPSSDNEEKPVGTVCIGLASKNESQSFQFLLTGSDRLHLKKRFSEKGFFELLRFIKE